jgi:hypothetical protein
MKRRIHSVLPLFTALPRRPKPPIDESEVEALLEQFNPKPEASKPEANNDPWGLLQVKRGEDT